MIESPFHSNKQFCEAIREDLAIHTAQGNDIYYTGQSIYFAVNFGYVILISCNMPYKSIPISAKLCQS
ncbi:hypothetical protein FJTKL_01477 [Diaporthe vaccinii]|uniref:Uncharacterized protein n=1 Tax=Diaporthe vaccinii TaxID=105482 RepID=A0ABR4E0H7_9PEZI